MTVEEFTLLSVIALNAAWVLLPLIPATIMFLLFPSSSLVVSGPLAAGPLGTLSVRATGAFGGYLVVFAVTYLLVAWGEDRINAFESSFWTITGQIKVFGKDGKEIKSEALLDKIGVKISNPDRDTLDGGHMTLMIPQFGGRLSTVKVYIPQFGWKFLEYKPGSPGFDPKHHLIELKGPVEIHENPPPVAYDTQSPMENVAKTH